MNVTLPLERMADCIRMLSVDAVQQARSGHPGAPMGMADMAAVLWLRHLKHHPGNPQWANRDRFVLSNGHASMLLYALLHLTGYDLPMAEIRRFRQPGSKTPGHPEVHSTPGVEATTGPQGQGLANAVGMALAEKLLAAEFNRDGFAVVDHRTWVVLGDGCLMAGISQEAISLAGTLQLGKLVALYGDHGIRSDGDMAAWFGDDTPARFRACGWQVIGPIDGHDPAALDAAMAHATAACSQPTLIVCRTTIGKAAIAQAGAADLHGAPLGVAGVAALRQHLGWTAPPFEVPDDLRVAWDGRAAGAARQARWDALFERYAAAYPALAGELVRRQRGRLPAAWAEQADLAVVALAENATKPVATRRASQLALDALVPLLPELLGGSADLTGSTVTNFAGCRTVTPVRAAHHPGQGVRASGMAAVMNGVALHGGLLPFGGTLLTCSDDSRHAIRMAALMCQRVVHVFTHDSIGMGEDGPSHQPVEQVAALRLIPGLDVWRPADALETAVAWVQALQRSDGPSALVLSHQALPIVARPAQRADVACGGYVLADAPAGQPAQAVIIATGSEVGLALEARARLLHEEGIATRVVSMPCTRRFDAQPEDWRDAVLPPTLPTVAVEAGHPDGWRRYTGRSGAVIGIACFGVSAPGPALMAHLGCTADAVMAAVRSRVAAATAPAVTRH